MVLNKVEDSKMYSTFFFKPGQNLKNTKASDRALTLICPKSSYQRLLDCTTEKERLEAGKKKEAEKLEAFKKASFEMTKTWDNTIQNINTRRKEELLSRKHQAELEREQFVKDMAEKNAARRAEIVKEARKLLLYRKPLCRRINSALLASECFRELEAQLAFQKTLKEMEENEGKQYVDTDSDRVKEEEKKEMEERLNKQKNYSRELKQQIDENRSNEILLRQREAAADEEDLKNMTKELEMIKQCETEEMLKKKQVLRQMFEETMEQKRNYERDEKSAQEHENRVLEVYRKAKERIRKLNKEAKLNAKAERERRAQLIADTVGKQIQSREVDEEAILQKAVKEKEAAEEEKREARKDYEKSLKADKEKFWREFKDMQARKEQAEKEYKTWEMMQRFKRDEYNKQVELDDRKREWEKKMEYSRDLQKYIEEQEAERKRRELEDEKVDDVKEAIERATKMLLDYGNQVLEESKGVRPLYPILKAIEESKKEIGLPPVKKIEEDVPAVEKPRRKRGIRRMCTKPIPEEQAYYF